MARETIVRLKDDLDGSDADTTIQFSWAGVHYEIDLSTANAAAFAAALAPFLDAARRASGRPASGKAPSRKRRVQSAPDLAAVRDWANSNGYQVSGRGRVASAVIDAYRAARRVSSVVEPAPAAEAGAAAVPSAASRPTPARKVTSAGPRKPARKATGTKRAPAKKAAAKKAPVQRRTAKPPAA